MNDAHGTTGGHRRTRAAGAALGTLALLGALTATGCSAPDSGTGPAGDRAAGRTADDRWVEGVTPGWMSGHMGVDIPAAAQDARAGYQVTPRFDTGVLTFTLTRSRARAFPAACAPAGELLEPTAAVTDVRTHDFGHLGVPEPETFKKGMRYGSLCPGADPGPTASPDPLADPNGTSDTGCVSLYAHDYAPDRTRIYLRDHYEPGISPLPPTPPASSPTR
ncbi:hypothetical protein AB0E62_02915 [Streptomyces sp. NPDC038707]|uniref:hypothetical protein n=1 Tax=Streptomyces sp. NPDC038707 TaxID=3154329 RepID=UPI0033E8B6D7